MSWCLQTRLIARSLFDLFGAGTDTTANTLRWALLLMTQFPDIQAKVLVISYPTELF